MDDHCSKSFFYVSRVFKKELDSSRVKFDPRGPRNRQINGLCKRVWGKMMRGCEAREGDEDGQGVGRSTIVCVLGKLRGGGKADVRDLIKTRGGARIFEKEGVKKMESQGRAVWDVGWCCFCV